MKKFFSLTLTLAVLLFAMSVSAQAADYAFETDGTPEYYPSSSYEDIYGSRYNYGGKNAVDYQIPELEYGQLSTTQTGVMEKIMLPGLQGAAATGSGIYGISSSGGTVEIPGFLQGNSAAVPLVPAFTELSKNFLLSNGAVGKISIPAIGVKNYYLWEGETTASMKKGLGHFTGTSVWNGNVAVCGHNRGAKYVIGSIKDLDVGDKITYTTSMGTRTYLVETVTKISSSDWSYLSSTADNRITLFTCVAGDPSQRWCVQVKSGIPYTGEAPAKAEPDKPESHPEPAVPANDADVDAMKQDIVDRTNALRKENGIAALTADDKLMQAAQVRAEEMAASGVYSHIRPDGRKYMTVTDSQYIGENIHCLEDWALKEKSLPETVMWAWSASAGHLKNMTNSRYGSIGVGLAKGTDENGEDCWYCVQLFMDTGCSISWVDRPAAKQ